ncbi:hypothetical protein K458DRAFT_395058 [Lentithecium fluviatile CBS 122367]|uniref:BYS1 domain protein n=1 Tax=Lentithecium fluviatile CBS 122367 TaxID=1168545 RepID=A0A6G1IJS9_9PLEO|nr:hypothetical protein K458DRAFT_395058 [Lentithecium fluviatile CBS 122367]
MLSTILPPLLFAALVASNELSIYNFCGPTIYAWHQGSQVKPLPKVDNGSDITTKLDPDPITGGRNIILSYDSNGINNDAPTIQLSYQAVGTEGLYELWYALQTRNGNMVKGRSVDMGLSGSPKCARLEWRDGKGDSGVKVCRKFKFADLRLCTEGMGKGRV